MLRSFRSSRPPTLNLCKHPTAQLEMEAIAALGLAFSILQVVQCSTDLAKTLNEVQKSGSTTRNQELIKTFTDLNVLSQRLKKSCGPRDGQEGPLLEDDQVRSSASIQSQCLLNFTPFTFVYSYLISSGTRQTLKKPCGRKLQHCRHMSR